MEKAVGSCLRTQDLNCCFEPFHRVPAGAIAQVCKARAQYQYLCHWYLCQYQDY